MFLSSLDCTSISLAVMSTNAALTQQPRPFSTGYRACSSRLEEEGGREMGEHENRSWWWCLWRKCCALGRKCCCCALWRKLWRKCCALWRGFWCGCCALWRKCCASVQYIWTTVTTWVCANDETPVVQPFPRSSEDTARYRGGYQGKRDNPNLRDNHLFYTNAIPYRPGGMKIDEFHSKMWGRYQELEWNHSYIQWLFPIRQQGMNRQAQELQQHEIRKILRDEKAKKRLMTSYKLMLDFYGMRMKNDSGELERSHNYRERFHHLNSSQHNYMRITRILKCLGEFDMEHLKAPFIRFVLHEATVTGELPNVLNSCTHYWVEVLRRSEERQQMQQLAWGY